MSKYVAPAPGEKAFVCPHCEVYAQQVSAQVFYSRGSVSPLPEEQLQQCTNCGGWIVWWNGVMVYPDQTAFPPPNEDLPDGIRVDYCEAASIAQRSPRGAAALLRLSIQKLCEHLGYPQNKIDDAIAAMVAAGLPQRVSQMLDVVRVIGNNAVHPGNIDLTDDVELATNLARLVNLIAEDRISNPRHVQEMYAKLPASNQAAIAARNAKALPVQKGP